MNSKFQVKDKRSITKHEQRTMDIDSDLARYGESYCRITVGDDGQPKMEHVPHNLVRPILALQHPGDKK